MFIQEEKMFGKKEIQILSNLRNNGREKLTNISRKTKIPVSTIFDKIRRYEENFVIKKHSCLLNFSKLGFEIDVNILIKVEREERDLLKEYLLERDCLNSIYKLSNGYDFMVEGIFRDMQELNDFLEELENGFNLMKNDVLYIVNELKREDFMNIKEPKEEENGKF